MEPGSATHRRVPVLPQQGKHLAQHRGEPDSQVKFLYHEQSPADLACPSVSAEINAFKGTGAGQMMQTDLQARAA